MLIGMLCLVACYSVVVQMNQTTSVLYPYSLNVLIAHLLVACILVLQSRYSIKYSNASYFLRAYKLALVRYISVCLLDTGLLV